MHLASSDENNRLSLLSLLLCAVRALQRMIREVKTILFGSSVQKCSFIILVRNTQYDVNAILVLVFWWKGHGTFINSSEN